MKIFFKEVFTGHSKYKSTMILASLLSIFVLCSCENNEEKYAKSIDGDWKGSITIPNQDLTYEFHHNNHYIDNNEGTTKARVLITEHFKSDTSNSFIKEVFGELEFKIVLEKEIIIDYYFIENSDSVLFLAHYFNIDSMYTPTNINIIKSQIINPGNNVKGENESEDEFKRRILTDYIDSTIPFTDDLTRHKQYDDLIHNLYREPAPFKLIDNNSFVLHDGLILFEKVE